MWIFEIYIKKPGEQKYSWRAVRPTGSKPYYEETKEGILRNVGIYYGSVISTQRRAREVTLEEYNGLP